MNIWMKVAITTTMLAAGCGSGSDGGGSGGGFIASCQNMMTGTVVLSCVEHYGDASVAANISVTYKAVCDAQGGTWSTNRCPTASLLGRCKITAAGAAAYGVYDTLFVYSTPGTTAATAMSSCASAGGAYTAAP